MKLYHKATALFLSLVFAFSCFSCAETPDKDIVVNKGDGVLEDKIENSTGNGLNIDTNDNEHAETYDGYILHESGNFTSANEVVKFNVDADVYIPKNTEMPVLKVSPNYWTPESIEKFARIFIGDAPVYEYTDALTKKDIEKTILELQQEINDRDGMLEYYEGDEERVKRRVAQLTEKLSAAEAEYETASDTVEKVVSDFEFHNDTHWYSGYGVLPGLEGIDTMKATAEADGVPFFIWAQHKKR